MDARLLLELLPAAAFLVGNTIGGLFWAAGAAVAATLLAIMLRWRWDRTVPWLALATLVLALVLLAAGLWFEDATYIKLRPTLGSLGFAVLLATGALTRPSLLRRTLGYRLRMTERGWVTLHVAWIVLALGAAAANEIVWRTQSDDAWASYAALSGPALFGLFWFVTRVVADRYWDEASVQHDRSRAG